MPVGNFDIDPQQYEMLAAYTQPVKKAERPIVGREQFIRRIKAALMRPELCNVMLLAPPGSGKAHPNDTIIPVDDDRGYTRVGDLVSGDRVFNAEGRSVEVLHIFPQGKKRVYRVLLSNGSTVLCNDEHLWSVRTAQDKQAGRDYTVRTLREIMEMKALCLDNDPEAKRQAALAKLSQKRPAGGSGYRNGRKVYVPPAPSEQRRHSDYPALIPRAKPCERRDTAFIIPPRLYGMLAVKDTRVGRLVQLTLPEELWDLLCNEAQPEAAVRTGDVGALMLRDGIGDEAFDVVAGQQFLNHGSIRQRVEVLSGAIAVAGRVQNGQFVIRFEDQDKMAVLRRIGWSLGMDCFVNARASTLTVSGPMGLMQQLAGSDYDRGMLSAYAVKCPEMYDEDDIFIKGIEDMEQETEMTCIQVDDPRRLYQVGPGHVVTHNTAVVQGTMLTDPDRLYLEVDLAKMISNLNDVNEMAAKLKQLFDETAKFVKYKGREIVLFIDEFHQVVQLSDAAVEALKPLLADSGTRGIKVIAATTFVEFRQFIAPNQPLVERLQRINLPEPDEKVVMQILRGMAERYGVAGQFPDDRMFHLIYEYTNRYIPANAQPRKSILVMDAMIGWYRVEKRHMDEQLLADVLYESEGINVAFKVDPTKIKETIDKRVLSQDFATRMIEDRLQICVAGLNNQGKPMSSFLFSGSTGAGKTETAKSMADILFGDPRHLMVMNMTEYANPDSLERFRKELTTRIWERPYSIVLLDEIEKACSPVTRLLLSVLDEGQLSDVNNRIVSFKNAYIIMTTNAGSEVYKTIAQYNADDKGSGSKIMEYYPLIRDSISSTTGDNKFPPELLGRIDVIVPFQPLSEDTMKKIVTMNLKKLNARVMQQHGVELHETQDVVTYLVEDNMTIDSDAGGARMVMQKLESDVTVPVAAYINAHPKAKSIWATVEGTMLRDNKKSRVSEAHIVITEREPPRRGSKK